VGGAAQLGFEFLARTQSGCHVSFLGGKDTRVHVLETLEFSGERRRMSVIIRLPAGPPLLLCKGADVALLPRLSPSPSDNPPELMQEVNAQLYAYSTLGLRTLVVAGRTLTEDEYATWAAEYRAAALLIGNYLQ
jgi:magnesium-transporting ATPase (P-type)